MPYLPNAHDTQKEVLDLLSVFLLEQGYADEGHVFKSAGGTLYRGKLSLPPWKALAEDLPGKCFIRAMYNRSLTVVHGIMQPHIVGVGGYGDSSSFVDKLNKCDIMFYNRVRSDAPFHLIHLKCEYGHNLENSMLDLHDPESLDKLKRMIDGHMACNWVKHE